MPWGHSVRESYLCAVMCVCWKDSEKDIGFYNGAVTHNPPQLGLIGIGKQSLTFLFFCSFLFLFCSYYFLPTPSLFSSSPATLWIESA